MEKEEEKEEKGTGIRFLIALILVILTGYLVASNVRAYNKAHPQPPEPASSVRVVK